MEILKFSFVINLIQSTMFKCTYFVAKIIIVIHLFTLSSFFSDYHVNCERLLKDDRYYNHNGQINVLQKSWMKSVSNDTYLYQLSLPGTHDTMALFGGLYFETQSMNLYSQLRAGIRTLDIRCRHIGDRFEIHHGVMYQNANFDHVLAAVTTFLGSFPSEVILMRVKEEYSARNNTRTFLETFEYYIDKPTYRHYFWPGQDVNVQLGQIRGKIVILRDFPGKKAIGIPWSSFDIQDDYKVPSLLKIAEKWMKIVKQFEKSKNNHDPIGIINFLSAFGLRAPPAGIAKRINPLALIWLFRNQVDCVGIVYMDFPGETLIRTIIGLNYGLKITNLMDTGTILKFQCNHPPITSLEHDYDLDYTISDQSLINLKVNSSYQYQNKLIGINTCKFWARTKFASIYLTAGNERIVATESGLFRQRDDFADRQEVARWKVAT